MSNLESPPNLEQSSASQLNNRLIAPRQITLHPRSDTVVNRNLPHRDLRTIGPWCFLDQFGPVKSDVAMSVAAHPHTGLQTVTWLIEGSVLHQDSLGTESIIKPGELNLMTSGFGIAHSELSVTTPDPLHGIQLWVALPNEHRNTNPQFEHLTDFPIFKTDSLTMKIFAGNYQDQKSPATFFSDIIGAEIDFKPHQSTIELNPTWQYGLLAINNSFQINNTLVPTGHLYYLNPPNNQITLNTDSNTKILLIGGPPMTEKIIMWWNFLARTHDEIVQMRNDWQNQTERFPTFTSNIPSRIPAPPLPNLRLNPR